MSSAQAAQQNNRTGNGQYATKTLDEAPVATLPTQWPSLIELPADANGDIDVAAAVEAGYVSKRFSSEQWPEPRTVSFHGHWEGNTIVVEDIYDGNVLDDREDDGEWDEGLWASSATASSQAEAATLMLADHTDQAEHIC